MVRFAAEVKNFGNTSVNNLRIVFQVDDAPPQYQTIANLLPAQSQEVVFPYLFASQEEASTLGLDSDQEPATYRNFRVLAEIDRESMSASEAAADQLVADSTAYCATRIFDGIPVLLVDGDPSAISERSETHYLNSLNVLGTGLRTETCDGDRVGNRVVVQVPCHFPLQRR